MSAERVFAPAVQQTLVEHVYDALRQAIVTGALKPGQRVNEAEVARQMQTSRGPIREAIRRLEQAGLLVSVPRRGTTVVSLSADDVEEVYTLRADLETRAVERAIGRLSEADFAALERWMQAMQSAGDAGDLAALLDADIEFHRTIVKASGWPQLQHMWESLHPRTLTLHTMRTLVDWSAHMHADRHMPVLEALRAGDAEHAMHSMRQHILGVGLEIVRVSRHSNGPSARASGLAAAQAFGPGAAPNDVNVSEGDGLQRRSAPPRTGAGDHRSANETAARRSRSDRRATRPDPGRVSQR